MAKLLVIDTETGGLDPERHSILSLAVVVWIDGQLGGEIEILIAEPDLSVTAQALEVNRIDLVEHSRRAVAPSEAVVRLEAFLNFHFQQELVAGGQIALVGHNINFDLGFLRRLYRVAGSEFPNLFSHRILDTASILRFLSLAGRLPAAAVASSEAFALLGVTVPEEMRHTALGDARGTADMLTRLIDLVAQPDEG